MIKKATNVQYGYTIEGNTIQDGVPSPQNPVMPKGTGDKTENLFSSIWEQGSINGTDGQNVAEGTIVRTKDYIPITPNIAYSFSRDIFNGYMNVRLYRADKSYIGIGSTSTIRLISGTTVGNPMGNNTSFCCFEVIDDEAAYIRFNDSSNNTAAKWLMVEGEYTSQTMPEYEPYGYKIQISSEGENLFPLDENKLHIGRIENDGTIDYQVGTITVGTDSVTYEASTTWRGFYTDFIQVNENETLTFSPNKSSYISWACCCYDENDTFLGKASAQSTASTKTFTLLTGTKKVRMAVTSSNTTYTISQPMLNYGSTALPYKPYIEPIEADIYLGQVQTTRNIKKLVLTGEETGWTKNTDIAENNAYYRAISGYYRYDGLCSHYATVDSARAETGVFFGANINFLTTLSDEIDTVDKWKSYLASQYTSGTPVCVWYVLATPEVSITNEPLMKIGNYVDTINNTQSGIPISTNNLTVNTIIPPSDISINTTATWVPIPYNKYNTETISTIAPIDFLSNGQNITVGLKGNTEQLEIPSPDNPVMPEGCGERTGNLADLYGVNKTSLNLTFRTVDNMKIVIDGKKANGANVISVKYPNIVVPAGTYTVKIKMVDGHIENMPEGGYGVFFGINQSTYSQRTTPAALNIGDVGTRTFTLSEDTVISSFDITPGYSASADGPIFNNATFECWFYAGSSSDDVPYEPYGYKIPISSDGENLFDKDNTTIYNAYFNTAGDWLLSDDSKSIKFPCLPNTQYTLSVPSTLTVFRIYESSNPNLEPLASAGNRATAITRNSDIREYTFTTSSTSQILLFQGSNGKVDEWFNGLMLVKGNTAKPYSPYNHTTTPVYLGEVETTRRIRKYEFTGQEADLKIQAVITATDAIQLPTTQSDYKREPFICSHMPVTSSSSGTSTHGFYGQFLTLCFAKSMGLDTLEKMRTYLQQQYANGTPVTVWYVLATETTGIVNEPLMKIGEYADEISNITIPTTKGSNTLSINTSVQPSNVQLSISGWVPHNNIKEYKNNAWMATSWEGFRDIVRAGNGPTRYPIGTKLYETWGDNTSNAWIIVDYDNSNYSDPDISALGYTHNVVLYEEKINYLKVFDNAEAWLYAESVVPAGTYRFTIPNYDATYGGNKTYIFTSTVDVPIHGQLTLSWPYQQNPVSVSAYTTNTSTTVLFTATVTEWDTTTACVDLGTIKLAMSDSDSTYGKLNHIHRARYGSNNYYQSGIRQWMNSDATANNWWKPTNIFDRLYSNANTDGGLYLINKDFKKVIAAPNITCITNNIFETGTSGSTAFKLQTNYTVRDKIFLPTHTELNLSSNPNVGSVFSQYTNAQDDDRIKYRKDNGNAYYYWFRTPYPSYGYFVRSVGSNGALNNTGAYGSAGVVRACIIQ